MVRRRVGSVAVGLVAALAMPLSVGLASAPAAAAARVTIDPAVIGEPFGGWGTSLAWSANYTGDWHNREELADLLFSSDLDGSSLGLTIARYNIGGGDDPAHAGELRPGAEVPGYRPDPGQDYDWSADPRQRWWLEAAKARVSSDEFVADAIAYSAPYWMTQSGRSIGNTDGELDNLLPGYEDDFAEYLADVVDHFSDAEGIDFRVLSPLNEPSTDYWSTAGRQEGMHVSPGEKQAAILDAAYAALESRDSDTALSAVDETSIDGSITDLRALRDAGFDFDKVDQVNTHTYSGGDRAGLRQIAVGSGQKRLQMSEVTLAGGPYDPQGIGPSLVLASTLTTDLKELQPQEWVYWQALESEAESIAGDGNWGLVHYTSDGSEEYSVTRKFSAMQQYSNFIRPGSSFVWNSGSSTVTSLNENRDELTIVSYNNGSSDQSLTFDLGGFEGNGAAAQVYRTSATEERAALAALAVDGDELDVTLPARSISTFTVPVTMPATPAVGNGDFELAAPGQDIPGWLTWGGDAYGSQLSADYTQSGGVSGGSNEAVHYGATDYHVRTYQSVALDPGMYTLRAEARSNGGSDFSRMTATMGDATRTADIPDDEAYGPIEIADLEVVDGRLDIGFETSAPGGRWSTFDNVTIQRQVLPPAALQLTFSGDAVVGAGISVAVAAVDRYGAPLGDVTGQVEIASSESSDGVSGARVSFTTPGSRLITAAVPGTDVTASIEVDVVAAPPSGSGDGSGESGEDPQVGAGPGSTGPGAGVPGSSAPGRLAATGVDGGWAAAATAAGLGLLLLGVLALRARRHRRGAAR